MTTPNPNVVPAPTPADDVIDKQERVEFVIDKRVSANESTGDLQNDVEFAKRRPTTLIATPLAPSATYVQAEAASMKVAVDAIRAALTSSGVTG